MKEQHSKGSLPSRAIEQSMLRHKIYKMNFWNNKTYLDVLFYMGRICDQGI